MEERKLTTLNHKQKREICNHKQKNPTLTNRELQGWVLETFGAKVHQATISRVLKKSSALLSNVTSDDVKRSRNPRSPAVEGQRHETGLTVVTVAATENHRVAGGITMEERKLTTLSHKQKRDICHHKQKHPDLTNRQLQAWVLETFSAKVHQATISRVLKKSSALLSNVTSNDVKRSRNPHCPALEEALYRWYLTAQEARLPISEDMLTEKAKALYEILSAKDSNIKGCKFSSGWLQGFKKRHNIQLRVSHGEGDSVQVNQDTWDQFAALNATLSTYEPCDVFNMDETGLFFKLQPNKSLRDRAVQGQKKDKTRITVGLCSNMDGSIKFPPLIINESANPRAFSHRKIKRPNNLGITWYSNRMAWMCSDVFQDWVMRFENRMKSMGRKKVALLVDNAPGHLLTTIADKLTITKVLFLPANTTARFQPMDVGIIQSFKCHYRKLFVRKQLADREKNEPFSLDIYQAVVMVVNAWNDGVTQQTIQNCWRHCSLTIHRDEGPNQVQRAFDLEASLQDDDLNAQLEDLGEYLAQLSLQFPVNLSVDEYIAADSVNNAPTFCTDADISEYLVDRPEDENEQTAIVEVVQEGETEDIDLIEPDIEVPHMAFGAGMAHFESLQTFLQQQDWDTYQLTVELKKMVKVCTKEHMKTLVQTSLDSFFELESHVADGMIDLMQAP